MGRVTHYSGEEGMKRVVCVGVRSPLHWMNYNRRRPSSSMVLRSCDESVEGSEHRSACRNFSPPSDAYAVGLRIVRVRRNK